MRILVTGGAGFLGSHLCEKLLKDDNEVICMDNFFTGSEKNIKQYIKNPKFKLIKQDVIEPFDIKVDQIYNMACPASPIHYQYNPIQTCKTCFLGAINCLENAKRYNSKILQASTSEVYGDPKMSPQKEFYWGNVNPIGIRSCYDEGKRVAETLFFNYHTQFAIDIRVVRIFNTYGPRMAYNDGRVVSNFVVQALNNESITIYGDGSQTRSFCYIDDLVDGLIMMMNNDNGFIGPVNLGNPVETSVIDLANEVVKLCDSKSKIIFSELPKDDPKRRKPSIEVAENKLGWTPHVTLSQGLIKTIEYFRGANEICNIKYYNRGERDGAL